jgi:uracil-DNA glycosylase
MRQMPIETNPNQRIALAALLEWYVENGVDLALDETPHNRYAECQEAEAVRDALHSPPSAATTLASPAGAPRIAPAIAMPDDAIKLASKVAHSAKDLQQLAENLAQFAQAPFYGMAEHFLFHAGAERAKLMILDAAPGVQEETTGAAFCGQQAQLLRNMLRAIGKNFDSARLSYVSPWRPPGNRPMTPIEIAIFAPFVRRQIELAQPEIILLFGEAPVRATLDVNESLSKLRGKWQTVTCGAHQGRALVFSSLEAMLKSPALKPAAWRDLRSVAEALLKE